MIVNYDPLGFVIAGILFSTGIFHFRFLDIIPVARRFLVDNMQDGIIVVDPQNRIIDINPEARKNFGITENNALGKDIDLLMPEIEFKSIDNFSRVSEIVMKGLQFELRNSPLLADGKTIGHLLIMRDITQQKILESQLRELASTDPLTGIMNRRRFFEIAKDEAVRAMRYKKAVSVLMIDCDRFKSINDKYGHQTGDLVLTELARICRNTIRETDILARYGGEEFIILSPETAIRDAGLLAERLRKAVENM